MIVKFLGNINQVEETITKIGKPMLRFEIDNIPMIMFKQENQSIPNNNDVVEVVAEILAKVSTSNASFKNINIFVKEMRIICSGRGTW